MSGKGVEQDSFSMYTVNPSDYTGTSLINYKLNGSNYLTWSRAMVTALTAKNKVGMIDGMVPRPPENDLNRAKWDVCNALEGMSVTKYYSRLKTLWDELDNYLEIPACTCSATKLYTAQREREKTHQFLMGLGSEFATVSIMGCGLTKPNWDSPVTDITDIQAYRPTRPRLGRLDMQAYRPTRPRLGHPAAD
ncbi:hypothetical protein CRG98_020043 [Punica granatum]|uniref:Retrotransposon Copia-like N-terminal domain-containing protein n=1 Tax=Punica granatum TaxID=22663 RepID=A0A2I0JT84_PUNGR|nr:hypothetical protein CRG98_020043 [Punica granatum]